MANVQLIAPNTNAVDYPGMCLRFTQRGFQNRNTIFYRSAWNAWENAKHPRYTATPLPDDVVVPIYFAHWGRYDDGLGWYQGRPPGSLGNWGHIALRFPNGAILSSPRWGDTESQEWFSSIAELERAFNATYVGWSYDLAGAMVADVAPATPTPKPEPVKPVRPRKARKMFMVRYKHGNPAGGTGWLVVGTPKPEILITQKAARGVLDMLGIENSYETDKGGWLKFLRMSGMSAEAIAALNVK